MYVLGHPRRPTTLQEEDRKLDALMLRHVRSALPVRIVGVHHYISPQILEYVVPVLLPMLGKEMRHRYVYHRGSEEQFLEELARYGISKDILPREMGGKCQFSYATWLDDRAARGL